MLDCGKAVNFTYYDDLIGVAQRYNHPIVPEPEVSGHALINLTTTSHALLLIAGCLSVSEEQEFEKLEEFQYRFARKTTEKSQT